MSKQYETCIVCNTPSEHNIGGSSVLAKCDKCMGITSTSEFGKLNACPIDMRDQLLNMVRKQWLLQLEIANLKRACKHTILDKGNERYSQWADEFSMHEENYIFCQGCGKKFGYACEKNPNKYCQPYPEYHYQHYYCGCGHSMEYTPTNWTCIHCGKFYEYE